MIRYLRARLSGLLLAGAVTGLAEPVWEINVVGDLTDLGRKVTPASREHPVFYVPLVVGHREEGAPDAGEKAPPPKDEILRQLAKVLAQHGYVVGGDGKPEPSLLLLFSWGSLNPVLDPIELELVSNVGGTPVPYTASVNMIANSKEMRALVAGNTTRNIALVPPGMTNRGLEEVRSDMFDDRYFVTVVAFDWPAAKAHKKVMLWSTKMSVASRRLNLDQVIAALIKSGGPVFGRETEHPQRINVPVREGNVEIGTPEVVKTPAESATAVAPGKKP